MMKRSPPRVGVLMVLWLLTYLSGVQHVAEPPADRPEVHLVKPDHPPEGEDTQLAEQIRARPVTEITPPPRMPFGRQAIDPNPRGREWPAAFSFTQSNAALLTVLTAYPWSRTTEGFALVYSPQRAGGR